MTFWAEFYDWYLRTEHPWDFRLVFEAIVRGGAEYQFTYAEELLPVLSGLMWGSPR